MPTDDGDPVLQQIGQLGAALSVARNEDLDPALRDFAQAAADRMADKLPRPDDE